MVLVFVDLDHFPKQCLGQNRWSPDCVGLVIIFLVPVFCNSSIEEKRCDGESILQDHSVAYKTGPGLCFQDYIMYKQSHGYRIGTDAAQYNKYTQLNG